MTDNEPKDTKKTRVRVRINENWCKKCGICVASCPHMVFTTGELGLPVVEHEQNCRKCMLCVVRCPDFAVDVKDEDIDE